MMRRASAVSAGVALALGSALTFGAACQSFGEDVTAASDAAADAGDGSRDPEASPVGAYAAEVAADAPLAWFPLDDAVGSTTLHNAVDAAKPASLIGGVALGKPSLVAGSGTAASFDGMSGILDLGSGLEFTSLSSYSLEVWIAPRKIDTVYRRIFSCERDVGSLDWAGYNLSVQTTALIFDRVTANEHCGVTAAPAIEPTTHHIVATFDGIASRLYVDGAAAGSETCGVPNANSAGKLFVGAITGARSAYAGELDEIAVYGTMLSPERISAHYQAGKR